MQDYLLSSETKVSKEEIQLIFKLRCKVTNLKMNAKGIHDEFDCEICKTEEESQKHIFECKQIYQMKGEKQENELKYEMIEKGNLNEKLKVAKIFQENFTILENYKNEHKK